MSIIFVLILSEFHSMCFESIYAPFPPVHSYPTIPQPWVVFVFFCWVCLYFLVSLESGLNRAGEIAQLLWDEAHNQKETPFVEKIVY